MQTIYRLVLAVSLVFWANLALAQNAELPREPDIEATITAQIDAFLVDDFATAFTYASPSIQSIFGTSERFGAMVRNGFPMVHRPDDVRYLQLRDIAGQLWQRVQIQDQRGGTHLLDYQMIQTPAGWRRAPVRAAGCAGACGAVSGPLAARGRDFRGIGAVAASAVDGPCAGRAAGAGQCAAVETLDSALVETPRYGGDAAVDV